jgi:phage terminase large subunit-like protein
MIVHSPYNPQHHQSRFHSLTATERLFLAGAGAGKTVTGLHDFIHSANVNSDCDGVIVAPTYPMFRDVILPAFERWIHPSLWTHKRGEQVVLWHPTGRRMFVRSATDPGRISGLTVGHAWFDEAALVRRDTAWKILQARVRDPRAVKRNLIATTTPEGYNWLIRAFAKPGRSSAVIRARTADNRHLPDGFETGLRAAYGEEYAAQYLDAEVLELSGMAWPVMPGIHSPSWLTEDYVRAQCPHFFGSADWGVRNPAALLVGGVDHDGLTMADGFSSIAGISGGKTDRLSRARRRSCISSGGVGSGIPITIPRACDTCNSRSIAIPSLGSRCQVCR